MGCTPYLADGGDEAEHGADPAMAKKRRRGQTRRLPVRTAPRENWGVALEVGGVVQSVSVPEDDAAEADTSVEDKPRPGPGGGYWGLMLPPGCPRRALLLGLGAGTVAMLLARRCPNVEIVGVECNAEVIATGRAEFGLDEVAHLTIVEADAFAWVADHTTSEPGDFDLICLDLFEAGRLAPGTLATPFLRQLATLLTPDGTLTVNLMVTARTPDQLHRLRRVFELRRELRLRGNLVVHATPQYLARGAEEPGRGESGGAEAHDGI
jgi:SAM-dependent methyltransferase